MGEPALSRLRVFRVTICVWWNRSADAAKTTKTCAAIAFLLQLLVQYIQHRNEHSAFSREPLPQATCRARQHGPKHLAKIGTCKLAAVDASGTCLGTVHVRCVDGLCASSDDGNECTLASHVHFPRRHSFSSVAGWARVQCKLREAGSWIVRDSSAEGGMQSGSLQRCRFSGSLCQDAIYLRMISSCMPHLSS